MSEDKSPKPSGSFDLIILEQASKMKKDGANNTQIRAFLEEHGMTGIVFEEDDIGKNPGIPPQK